MTIINSKEMLLMLKSIFGYFKTNTILNISIDWRGVFSPLLIIPVQVKIYRV